MLSIIIPTLNEEKYLPLLLDSIKKQSFNAAPDNNYEIIVADAGSKDRTVEIAKQYGCRVVKGGKLPAGRNRGAESAKGDIFLFLDADVILPEHFLKNAISEFQKERLGIAGFPVMPPDGRFIDKFFYRLLNVFSFLTQKFLPYSACAILSRKSVHQKIGGFDEQIIFIEDYPYAKAASKVSKYKFVRDLPFYTSVRRFEKDGRFNVYFKYVFAQLYMIFKGPVKSDVFKYEFGAYDKKNKTKGDF